ncbi:MAG: hypothetical protein ACLFN5_01900 [bacterium]
MKVYLIFSANTPLLILSNFENPQQPGFRKKLGHMGITKYLLFEVPVKQVRNVYSDRFEDIERALRPEFDLRVLDYNGFTAFQNFAVQDLELVDKYEVN